MSRSYKKHWCHRDVSKTGKKQANVRVRRFKGDLEDGAFYKKVYSSYDVCDFHIDGNDWFESLRQQREQNLIDEANGEEVDWTCYEDSMKSFFQNCVRK